MAEGPDTDPATRKKALLRARAGSDDRSYLTDPNYFRLSYQHAAQLVHAELDSWYGPEILDPDAPNMPIATPVETLFDGRQAEERARQCLKSAELVLKSYGGRPGSMRPWWSGRHWWRPWGERRLSANEERLRRFLEKTLRPCTEFLLAGIDAYRGGEEMSRTGAGAEQSLLSDPSLAPRAIYNLACLEVAEGRLDSSLEALKTALTLITDRRRRNELGRWARLDPSLRPMRRDRESKEKLDRQLTEFGIPKAELSEEATPVAQKSPLANPDSPDE